jgi:hypothetical protein
MLRLSARVDLDQAVIRRAAIGARSSPAARAAGDLRGQA